MAHTGAIVLPSVATIQSANYMHDPIQMGYLHHNQLANLHGAEFDEMQLQLGLTESMQQY